VGSTGWSARAVSRADGGADVFARAERWGIAAPVALDAEERGLSALECVLGALGGDLVTGFLRLAAQRRLPVDHAEAAVRGELDHALAYLGVVGEEEGPALGRLAVRCFVASPAAEAAVRAVWEEALARSPLANTLRTAPGLDVRLTVTA
jgi:hypothetical protein